MAEKEGFEPSIPFWGIHDFQSCALDQLRDFSMQLSLGHRSRLQPKGRPTQASLLSIHDALQKVKGFFPIFLAYNLLHVIARSEATRQSVLLRQRKAKRNYSRRIRRSCGFALSIANLLSFPAGTRIATPVCALARNDMLKTGACQRMQVGGHEEKCVDGSGFTWYNVLAYADTQQVSACHCEERSDAAIRSPAAAQSKTQLFPANT